MASNFSLPSMRYYWCHRREPFGLTKMNSPSKSNTLYGLSRGFRFRIVKSVKGMMGVAPFQISADTPRNTPRLGLSQRTSLDGIGQTGFIHPIYTRDFWMSLANFAYKSGGEGGTRTPDPVIMSHVL